MSSSSQAQMPLRIPASLHEELKQAAENEGISLNQYCLYLLSRNLKTPKEYQSQKGEELLRFLEEALVFQKELKPSGGPLKKMQKPQQTPKERWRQLHAGH
jgi:hypothetical protein